MKLFSALIAATLILTPVTASASYICNKKFAEMHGTNCPAGSVWDKSYHACIVRGS